MFKSVLNEEKNKKKELEEQLSTEKMFEVKKIETPVPVAKKPVLAVHKEVKKPSPPPPKDSSSLAAKTSTSVPQQAKPVVKALVSNQAKIEAIQRDSKKSDDMTTDLIDQMNQIEAERKQKEDESEGPHIDLAHSTLAMTALDNLEQDRRLAEYGFSEYNADVTFDDSLVNLKSHPKHKRGKHPHEKALISTKSSLNREDFQMDLDDALLQQQEDGVDEDDVEVDLD